MRLSTIFGDKVKDKSPGGQHPDLGHMDLGTVLQKQSLRNQRPPKCGALSPFEDFKNTELGCTTPLLAVDSQISSFQGTMRNAGLSEFPIEGVNVNGASGPVKALLE